MMKVSDFCITDEAIPQDIADKILTNFIMPINNFTQALGINVFVSKKSGWRPIPYEFSKNRSGRSEHTFSKDRGATGLGAADIITEHRSDMSLLGFWLLSQSPFRRITYYRNKGFYHVDYASKDNRLFFEDWVSVNKAEFIKAINFSID